MIHACGMTDLPPPSTPRRASAPPRAPRCRPASRSGATPRWSPRHHASPAARRQRGALHARRPQRDRTPRSAARPGRQPHRPLAPLPTAAWSSIGNAPTALFRLLELILAGRPPRGGDRRAPSASSARPNPSRALADLRGAGTSPSTGAAAAAPWRPPRSTPSPPTANDVDPPAMATLFGIGVGPGDPDLMTVKARRAVEAAPSSPTRGAPRPQQRLDRRRAVRHATIRTSCDRLPGHHRGGRQRPLRAHDRGVLRRVGSDARGQLDAGHDVAVICEGDPFFYGSYMYLHERLADRYPTTVVSRASPRSARQPRGGRSARSMNEVLTDPPGYAPDRRVEGTRLSDGRRRRRDEGRAPPSTTCARPPGPPASSTGRSTSSGRARQARSCRRSPTPTPSTCRTSRWCWSPATIRQRRRGGRQADVVGPRPGRPDGDARRPGRAGAGHRSRRLRPYLALVPPRGATSATRAATASRLDRARHALDLARREGASSWSRPAIPGLRHGQCRLRAARRRPDRLADVEVESSRGCRPRRSPLPGWARRWGTTSA